MNYCKISKTEIFYEMCPSTKAKQIRITIINDKVRVSFPRGSNEQKVKGFVEDKKAWILKTLEANKRSEVKNPQKNYQAGEIYLLQGRSYMLQTKLYQGSKPYHKLIDKVIWVYLPENIPENYWLHLVKEELSKWYKNQAHQVYQEKLEHYSKIMGLKYNQLRIKNQATRWGSCSSKSNLNLNWRVIMAPEDVIDYLIIHELAHLKFMNHSQQFWQLVASFKPDYEVWRKWLKDNGRTLVL
ncbi:MAG: hypothetical protein VR72_13155 [Clostridiaceae bacterium BRH_c20a]|nr:MAG: hypothetical protein VR72_13155 [Clostridiaceae bacterium BRH_c20a]